MTLDADSFRTVLSRFATGVTVVTSKDAERRDVGMTVSAFSSVSLHPPLVQICIGHDASAYEALKQCDAFVVNVLADDQEELSRRFAEIDSTRRFDGLDVVRGEFDIIMLEGALAHLECKVVAHHVAGDHTIFVGEVHHGAARDARPLLYFRGGYAQLVR